MENLTWNTEFKTEENVMIHTFSDRIKVITNLNTGKVKAYRDSTVLAEAEDMTLHAYTVFLIQVANSAKIIKNFRGE